MSLTEIFVILIVHWIADFILQTDKQAKGKSKNWRDLLSHTCFYSIFWFIPLMLIFDFDFRYAQLFCFVTFVCHTITDYFTSRLNSRLLARGDHHNFFVSVGFDQLLHYFQLFILFNYLK